MCIILFRFTFRSQSKLSERQDVCSDSAVRCLRDTLQALRSWAQSTHAQPPSDSASAVQVRTRGLCATLRCFGARMFRN